jgi:4-amino-4-deoxy-L-arabinose transferase-like glycosyltransferase
MEAVSMARIAERSNADSPGETWAWFALGVALVLAALVRWTLPVEIEDLRPRPDALEYEEAARNLVTGEGYSLVLDGGRYPPRYPPGFSLLLAPAMWLTGGEFGAGVWVVLVCALGGVAAVWALGLMTGGPASATAAVFLLALAPLHVRWSRAVMSDVPAATATTLLVLGGILCVRRDARSFAWLALGAAAGLAALLRPTCTLLATPLGIATLATREPGRRLLAFGTGLVVGLVPTALYGLLRFGSPLASGYGYWVPAEFFGWSNAVNGPAGGGTTGNLAFYLRQLAGASTLYPWPVALLGAAGLALALRGHGPARMLAWLTLATTALLLAIYVPFFWQADRFLLLALPLVTVLAALPVGTAAPRGLRLAGVGLVGIAVVGAWLTPGAFAPPDGPLGEVASLRAISERVERNAVLIGRSTVMPVARLFHDGTDRVWVPLDRCEHRALIRQLGLEPYAPAAPQNWVWDAISPRFDPAIVEGVVHVLLASGRPVYFAPLLLFEAPFGEQFTTILHRRFVLEAVPTSTPTGLMQISARPGATP